MSVASHLVDALEKVRQLLSHSKRAIMRIKGLDLFVLCRLLLIGLEHRLY